MKVNITRFTAALVLILQWVAVTWAMRIGDSYEKIFADFSVKPPELTAVALKLMQPMLLIPVAIMATLVVVAAEVFLKSIIARFAIQITDLSLWILFTCFCVAVIFPPLFDLISKLSH